VIHQRRAEHFKAAIQLLSGRSIGGFGRDQGHSVHPLLTPGFVTNLDLSVDFAGVATLAQDGDRLAVDLESACHAGVEPERRFDGDASGELLTLVHFPSPLLLGGLPPPI
jgi:hypothetical protein